MFQDTNADGLRGPFEPYTVTDVNGNYALRNISGGYRYIIEEVPGGYSPIYPISSYYFSLDGEYLPGFTFYNDRVLTVGPDRGAYEGQTLVFTAAFTPTGSWTYQWSVDGVECWVRPIRHLTSRRRTMGCTRLPLPSPMA